MSLNVGSLLFDFVRIVGGALMPAGPRARLGILMYHRVLERPDPLTGEVTAAEFDTQMDALRQYFNVLPLREAVEALQRDTLPERAMAVTFDDGYADNARIALPILRAHGLPATFFIANGYLNGGRMFNDTVIEAVRRASTPTLSLPIAAQPPLPVGTLEEKRAAVPRLLRTVKYLPPEERAELADWLVRCCAERLPDDLMMRDGDVRSLVECGMDVGGHTVSHPILTRIDEATARKEITENRSALQTLTGGEVTLFAYPNGVPGVDYSWRHTELAREAGYRAAVSTSWGAASRGADLYQLPRFTPWDRTPRRFVLRLLHNLIARRPQLVSGREAVGVAS